KVNIFACQSEEHHLTAFEGFAKMYFRILIFSLFNSALSTHLSVPLARQENFLITRGEKFNTTDLVATLNVSLELECISECLKVITCAGVNFNGNDSKCELIKYKGIISNKTLDADWMSAHIGDYLENGCKALKDRRGDMEIDYYPILLDGSSEPILVLCYDGWTILQHRQDGTLDFNQTLDAYINGFDNGESENWLGLHRIHQITTSAQYVARLSVIDRNGASHFADYQTIHVSDETRNYECTLTDFIMGSVNDGYSILGKIFRTFDFDNDMSCGAQDGGGWWFDDDCSDDVMFNGVYQTNGSQTTGRGIHWGFTNNNGSESFLESTIMVIRKTDYEELFNLDLN
ncbi:unnamed protein product, partial [Owenia fusiformis]